MRLPRACWSGAFVLTLCGAAWAAPAPAPRAPAARLEPVDLELVLAADTSQSIDYQEARLQRQGVAAAFRSPEVIRAIQQGPLGKIAVLYVDWSGAYYDRIVVNWQVVRDKTSADAFADALLKSSLTDGQGTAIGEAIAFAAAMIETNNYEGTQKTIDVSGDGPVNQGRPVAEMRDEIAARGIAINGLPIVTDDYGNGEWGIYYGELEKYYANCVIGGPRSFALPARGFQDFASAIRRKLVLELSDAAPPPAGIIRVAAAVAPPAPPTAPPRTLRPDPGVSKEQARMNCGGGPFRGRGFGGFR